MQMYAAGREAENKSDPATAAASGRTPEGMTGASSPSPVRSSGPTSDTSAGGSESAGSPAAERTVRSPGSGPRSPAYLSLALEEMQQEQEKHKWRVIRGSVLTIGGIVLVMLVIVRLLFAESVNNARPSTLEYRGATASQPSERANASRFADVGGGKQDGHYYSAWGVRQHMEAQGWREGEEL
ncbi:hypothetical protein HPB52_007526 [Rhipicephalus sanguineus]|uniref:Transmembrane protein n=1 Tax=Rhipicephalus sanguineus TaxID=34632 RepID=A0A9D4PLV9_RHISA|nr:hypothetical protein HPB52_007526 [Rhipicephalus sanguineus]